MSTKNKDTLWIYKSYSLQNDVRKKNTKNKISLLKVICCPHYRKIAQRQKQSNTKPHMKRDSIFLLILLLSLCCCSQKINRQRLSRMTVLQSSLGTFILAAMNILSKETKLTVTTKTVSERQVHIIPQRLLL